jgi:hypothetical protein
MVGHHWPTVDHGHYACYNANATIIIRTLALYVTVS